MSSERLLLFLSNVSGAIDNALWQALFLKLRVGNSTARVPRENLRGIFFEAHEFYSQPELCSPSRFFAEPPEIPAEKWNETRRRSLPDGEVVDVNWPSSFEPIWERERDDFLSFAPNRVGHARIWRHQKEAPTVVCLHGFRGGKHFVEEHVFPVPWLYSLGLNVALYTLPFHGLRGGPGAPVWPSSNVARTNEGFAQCVFDLRSLLAWLRRRHETIALTGMSLGAYTIASLCTLDEVAFAAMLIPVASFADVIWTHSAGSRSQLFAENNGITLELFREAMAVHSPLSRKPVIAPDRVLVASGAGDRVAPADVHATPIAQHFGTREHRMTGGHFLQLWRGKVFRELARQFSSAGIITRAR